MKFRDFRGATASLLITALVACGGGGGSASPPGASTPLLTVTGTAATGLAIPGAIVTGKCTIGTGTATTLADGSYTLTITGGQLPCVLQITNPVDGIKLHTVVTGAGSTATANITPLTEMATARVLGSEPNVFFAAFDAAVATQKITSKTVQSAQTDIGLVLTGTVATAALGDFISAPFKAATQGNPTSGDAQDKLLDALKLKLTSTQIGTLTSALASNQTTDTVKQKVASMTSGNVSAPAAPVANAGTAQSVVSGTTVTLDASTSSAAVGKTLTYVWTLISKPAGSSATIASPTSPKPTFVADVAGSYAASVIVNDGTTASSASAVNITASVANVAPVANAGVAQNAVAGSVVTLDGSTSSDANGDSLTYAWTLTAKPAGSSAALSSSTSPKPTFTADTAGTYVASLVVNDGKVGSNTATVSVTAAVANVAPVANAGVAQNAVAGSVVTLDGSTSSDANGDSLTYAWTLTAKPAGSSAALSSSTSPKPTFKADAAGTYVASLVVNDGKVGSNTATVSVTAAMANVAPVANAGVAQNVVAGSVVTLDGSTSSDANGDSLTYAWTLTAKPAGSSAALSSSTSPKPTFKADAAGTYVASLVVNDGKVGSNTTTVSVTAAVANVAPVASAGVVQNVVAGSVVTLDGSTSSDANGDSLTYAWTLTAKPAGSSAALSSSTSPKPTFTADAAGTYVASLVVNDGKVGSNTATVSVTAAVANVAPVANAGVAQNVVAGNVVTLDGSTSSDANGDSLTYAWTLTAKPAGSSAALSSSTSPKPTFTADAAGTYVASLVVNDGKVGSNTATVSVTAAVANVAPVASAGVAQNVVAGSVVTLDGSTSSDANGDSLTYAWTLTARPAGSTATLSLPTSAKPTFAADVAGIYVGTLIVNDGKVSSTAATVSVTATAATLTLYETSTSIFSPGDTLTPMPYSSTASSSAAVNCIGSGCVTVYDVASFKLIAVGQGFTISSLSAVNLTNGSSLVPTFSGLANGQVITSGTTVPFKLQSPFTSNTTVTLQYSFTVLETGKTFNYKVSLRTN